MSHLDEITQIFRETLENDEIVVTNETNADDIPEWDSLNHIYLVVAIEKHYGLKFTTAQIQSWKNVGEMIEHIQKATA